MHVGADAFAVRSGLLSVKHLDSSVVCNMFVDFADVTTLMLLRIQFHLTFLPCN